MCHELEEIQQAFEKYYMELYTQKNYIHPANIQDFLHTDKALDSVSWDFFYT